MNNYLVSTVQGNIYHIKDDKTQLVLKDNTKSLYTNDESIRFIKKYNQGYLLGKSESILVWDNPGGVFKLPGLVDIKDIIIGDSFVAILSGLRDSVYILNKELNQIIVCFNINKAGKLEFFKDRQVQCNEIPSNYFQIFYCPAMNNFHQFYRLTLDNNMLRIISQHYSHIVNLTNFDIYKEEHFDVSNSRITHPNIGLILKDEEITDIIIC